MPKGSRKFIVLENGTVATYVKCGNAITYKNPGCQMVFGFRDIFVKVSFRLSRVAEWRAIRDTFTAYLDSHRVAKPVP